MDNLIGKTLDGLYTVRELIGTGGMANVYKAVVGPGGPVPEGTVVAVKVLRQELMHDPDLVRRFKNESKAISLLNHPNIVKVYDVSVSEKLQYIVMEYVDGMTLREYLNERGGRLTSRETVHFISQILKALDHAHRNGVVHRDIKPQNIMLLDNGQLRMMDFGIARISRAENQLLGGKAMGSVHYISPEQAKGDETDCTSDIYSVGVMMYEMLSGHLPFDADDMVEVAIKQISDQPKSLHEIAPEVPNALVEITEKAMAKLPQNRYASAREMLDALDTYLSATLWIINPSGRLVLCSNEPINVENEIVIDNFDPTITEGSYYTVGNFFDTFTEEQLSVFAPITSDFKVRGYVVIHYPMSNLTASCNSLLNISYIMLVILFLLSLIILIFFTELVYLPLRKITQATEQYASGNMHYEFQIDSEDEIGYLGATISYMAGEIARSEDDQKKFVANVSHDFRSPLTSIKGYLEAMLDGTIPPELYEKYLNIVLNETERLRKLTNSLLTLNNLNTKGMLLDISRFNINAVIRNTAASFEGTCRKKMIAIELILTGDELYVKADVGKIQQVLYNLLDNAIKFSHEDSIIRIETTEKHNKVFVSVKDSGIGIPKDELKQIWERFYKSDLSRGKDKKGTGLGLSITREIIRSHGENINVISTEGVGSEFIFSLPVAADEEDED